MTDWKLINQAIIGINWLKVINDAENADKTLIQLLKERQDVLYLKGERVLNTGVLIMAAYILFVYPRETEIDNLDFSQIDISRFKITAEDKNNQNPKKICRRLRNSIAHANFEVIHDKNLLKFSDEKNGSNKIEFEIGIVDFGTFIDNFTLEVNRQNLK